MKLKFLPILLLLGCSLTTSNLTDNDYQISNAYPVNSVSISDSNYYQSLLDNSAANGLPGITMLVDNPSGFWAGSSGYIDIANFIDTKKYSLFKIGSISKTYTAAIILIIEDEGKLSIDDKITAYLPNKISEKIPESEKITIKHLLTHRSGIHNYSGSNISSTVFPLATYSDISRIWSEEDILKYIYNKPLDFIPGSNYAYSNSNYLLLGIIAESIECKSFKLILEEKIFSSIGLTNSYYPIMPDLPKGLARGYQAVYGDETLYDFTISSDFAFPDGGIIANGYNVFQFYKSIFDQTLLSVNQFNKMVETYSNLEIDNNFFKSISYGMGIYKLISHDNTIAYWHNGNVPGYSSEVYYFPDSDTTIVILKNCVNSPYSDLNWAFSAEVIWDIGR